jgi:site-specific recombinase
MKLKNRKANWNSIGNLFLFYNKPDTLENDELSFIIDLVEYYRPVEPKVESVISIESLIEFLKNNPEDNSFFKEYIHAKLLYKKFSRMLSDSGILQDSDFMYEVKKRLFAKILPFQPEKDTLEYILNQVFFKSDDPVWINKIPLEELQSLFQILDFKDIYASVEEKSPLNELIKAMGLLSQRMSGRAMESDVIKMVPEYEEKESPFVAFEKEMLLVTKKY